MRSQVPKSSRPLVAATTTSRPITRNTASCVPLQVRVGIVLAGVIMPVLADGGMRRQLFKPDLVIVVQATLIIVDEHAGRNVLRIYKGQYPLCGIPLSSPCRSLPSRR